MNNDDDALGTVTGFRTRLQPGAGEAYQTLHSRIPPHIEAALRECGLLSWSIWLDGETLFHRIHTRDGLESMVNAMQERGALDPGWDAAIARLVDDGEQSAQTLVHVWSMDEDGQHSDPR